MIGLYEVVVQGNAGQTLMSQRILMDEIEAGYLNTTASLLISMPTEQEIKPADES